MQLQFQIHGVLHLLLLTSMSKIIKNIEIESQRWSNTVEATNDAKLNCWQRCWRTIWACRNNNNNINPDVKLTLIEDLNNNNKLDEEHIESEEYRKNNP